MPVWIGRIPTMLPLRADDIRPYGLAPRAGIIGQPQEIIGRKFIMFTENREFLHGSCILPIFHFADMALSCADELCHVRLGLFIFFPRL